MATKEAKDFVTYGDDGTATIELSRPFEVSGVKLSVISMREPTVGDQLAQDAMKGGDAAKEITTMANLCEIAPDDIKRLPMRDYKRVQAAFLGFID